MVSPHLEVTEGAHRNGESLRDYLQRLKDAGLASLPGTAAEILDDEIRAIICSDKVNTEEWLECHRQAHSIGLHSNITIMYGSVEHPISWARHMVATRELQKETGGFTEFIPLPFVHMASPIYLQKKSRRGPTFRETVLMHAIGRIFYDGLIDNVQVSWVKIGTSGAAQLLQAGCNDLGRNTDGREHLSCSRRQPWSSNDRRSLRRNHCAIASPTCTAQYGVQSSSVTTRQKCRRKVTERDVQARQSEHARCLSPTALSVRRDHRIASHCARTQGTALMLLRRRDRR